MTVLDQQWPTKVRKNWRPLPSVSWFQRKYCSRHRQKGQCNHLSMFLICVCPSAWTDDVHAVSLHADLTAKTDCKYSFLPGFLSELTAFFSALHKSTHQVVVVTKRHRKKTLMSICDTNFCVSLCCPACWFIFKAHDAWCYFSILMLVSAN